MPISWNEIRHNAIKFSRDWTGAKSERAEKQTFWNEFFQVFGVSRRAVASFEEPVKKISGDYGYIDLFWPRIVLVEHKSAGKDLGKAESQAFRYIQDLARDGRHQEIPRYVIVSDFSRIALHDLESEDQQGLPLFDNRRVATSAISGWRVIFTVAPIIIAFACAFLTGIIFGYLPARKAARLDPIAALARD